MNTTQMQIAAVGLIAIAATTFAAPYRLTAENQLVRLAQGGRYPVTKTLWAPMWGDTPSDHSAQILENVSVTLDTGKLGLMWAAIAAAAAAAMTVASDSKTVDEPRRKAKPGTGG